MHIYQLEGGQVGLTFGVVLQKKDLDKILGHNPINVRIGPIFINISFCEPSKPVSFDVNRLVYFIPLCLAGIDFLKKGNSLVATHLIENVPFMLVISFEKGAWGLQYKLLSGSTLE